jgi:hypothetical protein
MEVGSVVTAMSVVEEVAAAVVAVTSAAAVALR